MNERAPLSDERLQEYLDGRLSPADAAAVAEYLWIHPEKGAEVQRLREQDTLLSAIGADVLEEPVPERLLQIVRSPSRNQDSQPSSSPPSVAPARGRFSRFSNLALAASLVGMFLAGGWSGWAGYQYLNPWPSLDEMALSDAARAYQLYGADSSFPAEFGPDRAADLSAWISRNFNRAIDPPDISGLGFQFVGGRIFPGVGGKSCMYLFQNGNGQKVALVFWGRRETATGGRTLSGALEGLQSRSWAVGDLGYALVGDGELTGIDDMVQAIQAFYQNLVTPESPPPVEVPAPADSTKPQPTSIEPELGPVPQARVLVSTAA